MATKKLSDLTLEELKSREKSMKMILGVLIGFTVVYILAFLYLLYIGKTSTTSTILLLTISIFLLSTGSSMSSIQKELKKRSNTQ
ncbi:MAG: hypothetical protein EAZ89_05775 [Bacteroidetes bacterium]|nr:MAG: hypothetical protein EAZ89_05775 [Bacteroidota bacterium]